MSVITLFKRYLRRKSNPIDLLKRLYPARSDFRSIIHVGAHAGQEKDFYEAHGFDDVLWIEASPSVYQRLAATIEDHNKSNAGKPAPPRHRTVCALLTDRDGDEVELHEFSNDGQSSSIFRSTEKCHSRWPHVVETGHTEKLATRTLDSVAAEYGMDKNLDVLVVDAQGAELLVLSGSENVLKNVKAVVSEVSTIPYYEGGALYPELHEFLTSRGFFPMTTPRRHGDVLFLRRELAEKVA